MTRAPTIAVAILAIFFSGSSAARGMGRRREVQRPQQSEVNPTQPAYETQAGTPDQGRPPALIPTDEHPWQNSRPTDVRNAGNLGPAGSWAPAEIGPSAVAGTPGERVPSTSPLPTGTPGGQNRQETLER